MKNEIKQIPKDEKLNQNNITENIQTENEKGKIPMSKLAYKCNSHRR